MPPTIKEIVATIQPFLLSSSSRPSFFKVAADKEMESKIHIISSHDVLEVLNVLSKIGIVCTESRSETHHIFPLQDGAHIGRISVAGQDEVWLKIKSKNTPVFTPSHHFPAVSREATKLLPGDDAYNDAYALTVGTPYVTFNKECINFFFPYNESIFSLSLSLAWNDSGFIKQEMEFEYEGSQNAHQVGVPADVAFETMLIEVVPAHLRKELHADTKYESLQNNI